MSIAESPISTHCDRGTVSLVAAAVSRNELGLSRATSASSRRATSGRTVSGTSLRTGSRRRPTPTGGWRRLRGSSSPGTGPTPSEPRSPSASTPTTGLRSGLVFAPGRSSCTGGSCASTARRIWVVSSWASCRRRSFGNGGLTDCGGCVGVRPRKVVPAAASGAQHCCGPGPDHHPEPMPDAWGRQGDARRTAGAVRRAGVQDR